MTNNNAWDMLKGVWSCFVGSLRVVLFFGCLIYVIIQALSIANIIIMGKFEHLRTLMPNTSSTAHQYMEVIFSLCLALLGLYGSFFKHLASIKVVSIHPKPRRAANELALVH